jgi:2-iminobutanoate/2-iminopropanoate deaminase
MKKILFCLLFTTNYIFAQITPHKEIIKTDKAPVPIAPYSQGVKSNGLLFVAGQIGLDPATRKLVDGGIEAETIRTMENIKAVAEAAGAKLSDIVNTTIYIKDINNFAKVNEIYGKYFTSDFPARTTVGVANLPGGANIEIAVIIAIPYKARRK